MGAIFNLLILGIVAVFAIDYSGFIQEVENYLTKWFRSPVPLKIPKPFSCSLCTTFWLGLFYLIFANQLTFINLLYLILIAALTKPIYHVLISLIGFIETLLNLFDHLTGQDM